MRFLAFSILSSLLLCGCGSGVSGPALHHGEFEPYYLAFEQNARDHGIDTTGFAAIPISMKTLDTGESGRCETGFFVGRAVYLSPKHWEDASEGGRHALMHHELGHCLLDREHAAHSIVAPDADPDARKPSKIPASLMNPTAVSGSLFDKYLEYYLEELFRA